MIQLLIETLLSFVWLSLPTVWAVLDDRNGDKHPNYDNVSVTTFGLILSAMYALLMRTAYDYDFYLKVEKHLTIKMPLLHYNADRQASKDEMGS